MSPPPKKSSGFIANKRGGNTPVIELLTADQF